MFIANPVGLLSAASCCLFQFAIKGGNKSPHNWSDRLWTLFWNELLKIVSARRMDTRRGFMRAALIVSRSYCYFLFTNPPNHVVIFVILAHFLPLFENLFPLKTTYSQTDSNACMILFHLISVFFREKSEFLSL